MQLVITISIKRKRINVYARLTENSGIANTIIGGYLLKSIVLIVCQHEYMNIPPNPSIVVFATSLTGYFFSLISTLILRHVQVRGLELCDLWNYCNIFEF